MNSKDTDDPILIANLSYRLKVSCDPMMSVICHQFALNCIKSTWWIVTKLHRKWARATKRKNLKNLVKSYWLDFKIIWYKRSFDDCQSCSNYFDWLKNMAARGVTSFTYVDIWKTLSSFLKLQGVSPWYLIVDLYQVCSNYDPVPKFGPVLVIICL